MPYFDASMPYFATLSDTGIDSEFIVVLFFASPKAKSDRVVHSCRHRFWLKATEH